MVPVSFCLDELTLRQLASGQIAEPVCSELEAHVRSCRRCSSALEAQFAAIVEALRMQAPPDNAGDEQRIAGLIERLKSLRQ